MRLWRILKNHLFPWHGNAHRPHILRKQWLFSFLAITLLAEAAILAQTAFEGGPHVFLAAVIRSDVISYTAQARSGEGGGTLAESELLNAAAQAKAEDMATYGYFSHIGPRGEEPWVWLDRAGYRYVYAGENLAVRFTDSKRVVDAWMASPKHRANIVKPQYQEIGVGLAEGEYKGSPATFVVQYFASPAAGQTPAAVSSIPDAQEPVAGAEIGPAPTPQSGFSQALMRIFGNMFTNPKVAASWALATVAALLITILALTFFVRIQVQPTDLLVPGAAVALVALTLMAANAKFLPADMQSASVAQSQVGDIGSGESTAEVRSAFPEHPEDAIVPAQ